MAASWKAPNRPGFEISQAYNDGLVQIVSITDTAAPGYAPVRTETVKHTLPFAERTVGVRRYYEAQQNQINVSRVIRVPAAPGITTQDVAVIGSDRYRLDLVQTVSGVYPASLDLSLVQYAQGTQGAQEPQEPGSGQEPGEGTGTGEGGADDGGNGI